MAPRGNAMSTTLTRDEPTSLLRIYLRDHDAAGSGGLRLIRRCRRSNTGSPFGPQLADVERAIEADRVDLERILRQLDVSPSRLRRAVAWTGATVGVLKLNGRVASYSPLSRVVELEALASAVQAKARLWETLTSIAPAHRNLDLDVLTRLTLGADRQLETLADLHQRAVAAAFRTIDSATSET